MPHLQCNLFAAFHPRMLVKTNNGFDSLYVLIVPLFPCAHEDIIPGRVTLRIDCPVVSVRARGYYTRESDSTY